MGAQYTRMAAMKQTALQATAIRLPHTKLREQTADWDESQGALYFEKASDESTWHSRNLQKLFTHGAHTFYTEKE